MSTPPLFRPKYSLADIFGPGHVYCPRSSDKTNAWLPKDRAGMDGASGASICVQGEMPLVCHRGAMTAPGLDLMRGAGFAVGSNLVPFQGEADYLDLLQSFAGDGSKLVIQFLHAPEDVDPSLYWIEPGLLSYINNKATLADFVSPEHVAKRRLLDQAETLSLSESPGETESLNGLPMVLKAASDKSSGGGIDVFICRTPEDLAEAAETLQPASGIVWEEYLEIRRNFCLAYVVWPDGRVEHIGDTEQVTDSQGKYKGNWLGEGSAAPAAAVTAGLTAASGASQRGYRGMVGIDVAETVDGRIVVFDLNFRLNGSSASALLEESVVKETSRAVSRFRPFKFDGDYRELLDAAERAISRGVFLPLSTFDPETAGYPDSPPKITGLVLGDSRDEVEEITAELESEGWS